jgi:hypothetical protein
MEIYDRCPVCNDVYIASPGMTHIPEHRKVLGLTATDCRGSGLRRIGVMPIVARCPICGTEYTPIIDGPVPEHYTPASAGGKRYSCYGAMYEPYFGPWPKPKPEKPTEPKFYAKQVGDECFVHEHGSSFWVARTGDWDNPRSQAHAKLLVAALNAFDPPEHSAAVAVAQQPDRNQAVTSGGGV